MGRRLIDANALLELLSDEYLPDAKDMRARSWNRAITEAERLVNNAPTITVEPDMTPDFDCQKKQASFSVSDTDAVTTKSMTVDMSTLSEASIDIYAVVGAGVTLTVGGQAIMQSGVWSDVLSATDIVRVVGKIERREGIYLSAFAMPVNADAMIQPAAWLSYLSESTDNNISVEIALISTLGALSAGCKGEVWGKAGVRWWHDRGVRKQEKGYVK